LLGVTSFDPNLATKLANEAIPELRRDAQTHAQSATVLGSFYESGLGVRPDPVAASRLYKSAADQGDARGMRLLAVCYFTGRGVRKDPRKGLNWLKRAADLGDTYSMVALGERYEQGDDCPKNPTLTFQLFEKAANAGSIFGMRGCARAVRERPGQAARRGG
jgi:TPR repeat protein